MEPGPCFTPPNLPLAPNPELLGGEHAATSGARYLNEVGPGSPGGGLQAGLWGRGSFTSLRGAAG